jgi:hypothetical protein
MTDEQVIARAVVYAVFVLVGIALIVRAWRR